MKRALKYFGLSLPLIVAGIAIGKMNWLDSEKVILPTGKEVSPQELRSQEVLSIVADQLNKTLPKKVDKETELQSVEGLEGELTYNYVKINASSDQFDRDFIDKMSSRALEVACESPDMELFFANGVRARYAFHGNDYKSIGEIVVTPNECGY